MNWAIIVATRGIEVGYFLLAVFPIVLLEHVMKDEKLKLFITMNYCIILSGIAIFLFDHKLLGVLFNVAALVCLAKGFWGAANKKILKQEVRDVIEDEIEAALRGEGKFVPVVQPQTTETEKYTQEDEEEAWGEVVVPPFPRKTPKNKPKSWIHKILK